MKKFLSLQNQHIWPYRISIKVKNLQYQNFTMISQSFKGFYAWNHKNPGSSPFII